MTENSTLLEVTNLSVGFYSYDARLNKRLTMAVRDLSISIRRGEILAVVGSSGSGKSLLAHAVMGILAPNSHMGGEIIYKNIPLNEERLRLLRGREIVFVPQSVAFLDPLMRVGEQVAYGEGITREGVAKVFSSYNLTEDVLDLYPFELSGGMARRVLLATASITSPELIIADEPTPGLDLKLAVKALADFRRFADGESGTEGKGVLLITHDIDLAINIADNIAIFHDGRVIEVIACKDFEGSGEGLRHPYSKALFKALPQNGFTLETCPKCGSSSATWQVDEEEMRCPCHD